MRAETLCAPVLAATLNGVYQGIILTIVVGMLLRLVPRTNAATRHAVWFVCLALVAVIVPAHYWLGPMAVPANNTGIATQPLVITPPPPRTLPQEPDLSFGLNLSGDAEGLGPEEPFEPGLLSTSSAQPGSDSGVSSLIGPLIVAERNSSIQDQGVLSGGGWAKQHVLQPIPWNFGAKNGWPLPAALVGFCLSVAALRLVLLGVRLTRLAQLTEGASCPDLELQSLFEHLRANARVNREVSLKVSELHRTPLVLGFFHPVILIPADLAADPDLAEATHVLAHELAHVRRYDDWANLFQHLVQALLFFHPSVWWINRKLSLEREIACDDHVLLHTTGPRTYALVLASVAKRISQRAPRLAPGVWNSNSQLQQRISMILNTRRNSSPALAKARLAWIVTATVLVGVAALQIGPRVVFAEGPAPKPVAEITANTDSPNAPHTVVLSSDAVSPMPVPAGISLVAHADAPGVEPGPKFKPDAPREEPSAAVVPEAPDAPSIDAVPPSPPHVARMSKPGKTPRPPGDPDTDNERDGSIEERVRRLEKMVHALAEQQKIKHAHGDIYFKDGADQEYGMAKQTYMIDQQELDRIKGSAERQAARAAEQAQRAAEQAKRATKDFQARILQEQQGQGEFREAFQRQLEALRKAREGLGQEMERLNRQIEKLEKEQQRSDKDGGKDQRRSDGPTEKLQAQAAPTPELK